MVWSANIGGLSFGSLVSFHSVICLHINLCQDFSAFAPNIIVTLPMSQLVLWHINDFAVAEAEHNAFPLLFGVSATVTWFRNHWCISIRCNCMLVSLRSIYQVWLSLLSVRDISLVFCLIWKIMEIKCFLVEMFPWMQKSLGLEVERVPLNMEQSYWISDLTKM